MAKMETILDHNITDDEIIDICGPIKREEYTAFIGDQDSAFAAIYRLYLLRKNKAQADKYLNKISDSRYKFQTAYDDILD